MAIALDTLVYARRLREAGFTEQQAEAQAEALAAAMTDALATKQDLRELELRIEARFAQMDTRFVQVDARFEQIDARFDFLERHIDMRFAEQERRHAELEKRFDLRLNEQTADLERRLTMRMGAIMVAGIGVFSAVIKLF